MIRGGGWVNGWLAAGGIPSSLYRVSFYLFLAVLCVTVPFFLSFLFLFSYSRGSFVHDDVPLMFSCPADHLPDWRPRILLGMVEVRSVNDTHTQTHTVQVRGTRCSCFPRAQNLDDHAQSRGTRDNAVRLRHVESAHVPLRHVATSLPQISYSPHRLAKEKSRRSRDFLSGHASQDGR